MIDAVLPMLRLKAKKPQKHYLFPPGWKVPQWIEDIRPNEHADDDWRKGWGRFVSPTYVRRESDAVHVYPVGINCGMMFLVDKGTTLYGAPTCLHMTYMVGLPDKIAVTINFFRK